MQGDIQAMKRKNKKKKGRFIMSELLIKKKEMRVPASLPSGSLGNDFSL